MIAECHYCGKPASRVFKCYGPRESRVPLEILDSSHLAHELNTFLCVDHAGIRYVESGQVLRYPAIFAAEVYEDQEATEGYRVLFGGNLNFKLLYFVGRIPVYVEEDAVVYEV